MFQAVAADRSVRALQDRAQREAERLARRTPLSRAARLYLISELARRGGAGLGVLGGMIACLAILGGLAAPARALIWAAMAAPALVAARRLLHSYLVGGRASRRPFHWRADYVAALCVLGAAFGSGTMLLAPAETSLILSASLGAAVLVASLAAALAHARHAPAATALWAPASLFAVTAALRGGGGAPLVISLAIGVLGAGLIAYAARRELARARTRHPLRSHAPVEAEDAAVSEGSDESDREAAAG
ncbi:MAG: hypothetical protein AAFR11_01815 [Pseudomonadota bacterium]